MAGCGSGRAAEPVDFGPRIAGGPLLGTDAFALLLPVRHNRQ